MTEVNVKLSIEASLHKGLMEFANQIYKDHGVRLQNVSFFWQQDSVAECDISSRYMG